MNRALIYLERNQWIFYVTAIMLLLPALFINIGMAPYSSDEPIRALVSLEMILSGEYITPTLGGIHYFYKPPLYNWILVLFFKLFGGFDEWIVRMPAILSLLVFAYAIYRFLKKKIGGEYALLTAFFIITSGDILFWDSLLGLIDITYSLITFLGIMSIYFYYQKKNYWLLFIVSYFLMTVGFMMKGLPSIAFQGITLLIYFIYKKDLKKLISLPHLSGIILFIILAGSYFLVYSKHNDVKTYLQVLFNQSSQRTVATHGWGSTALHIFSFPLEWLYHFAPWTLLVICCLRKDFFRIIKKDELLMFSLLVFIFNILIYWTSPEFHPRYILMLLPFAFIIFIHFYKLDKETTVWRLKIIENIFLLLAVLATISFLLYPFYKETKHMQHVWFYSALFFVLSGILSLLYSRIKNSRMIIIIVILLLTRIGFNLFLHPARVLLYEAQDYKKQALDVVSITKDNPVYVYKGISIHELTLLYIAREKMQIVSRQYQNFSEDDFYIVDEKGLEGKEYTNYYNIRIGWFPDHDLHLVKFHNLQ